MDVAVDYEAALSLCVLREVGIEIPDAVLFDLASGEFGTLNSAGALGVATAALYKKWSARELNAGLEVFPQTWEVLIQATIDGFEQMRDQVLAGWNHEMKRRDREHRATLRREKAEGDLEEIQYQHGGPLTDEVKRRQLLALAAKAPTSKRKRARRAA